MKLHETRGKLLSLLHYIHTIRYLKPIQVYGRIWHRLPRFAVESGAAPGRRPVTAAWQPPVAKSPSMRAANRFRFLNEEHTIVTPAHWNQPHIEKLWTYNLHYFDDLNADDSISRIRWHEDWIARWIRENPPGLGNGWEPYPLSLRIVNWIKCILSGNPPSPQMLHSLADQCRHLNRKLEWHLLGNHLFANAKALVFAGVFFSGEEADGWLRRGLHILKRQIPEQILADGGHFERSPMYHSIILEDLLDLINLSRTCETAAFLNGRSPHGAWIETAQAMRRWLTVLCHPDGAIPFFNDAAFGIAADAAQLDAYARRLGLGPVPGPKEGISVLPESGYVRLQKNGAVALLDVGEIGPDYLTGHAHADTLSFELSLYGKRVLVNSGTSCYGTGRQRLYERSTAAHNTVVVEGKDSSEVWSGFRVARRARPLDLEVREAKNGELHIACGHDGYQRLSSSALHRRTWKLSGGCLDVEDTIGEPRFRSEARFHFHPGIQTESPHSGNRSRRGFRGEGVRLMWVSNRKTGRIVASRYHPEFGVSLDNLCLTSALEKGSVKNRFRWSSK